MNLGELSKYQQGIGRAMHFLRLQVALESPSAYISRNASRMEEGEAEKEFHIVQWRDSLLIVEIAYCQMCSPETTRAHNLESSQKHGTSHPQVLEDGIHCQHKNQEIAHRPPYYQFLSKLQIQKPWVRVPIWPQSTGIEGGSPLNGGCILHLVMAPNCLALEGAPLCG